MYRRFLKRFFDFFLSLLALLVLTLVLPILPILTLVGAICMGGNPFFTQARPGKIGKDGKEKIFHLIKFRTMSNKRDENGNLLPDEVRLNKYGRFLRSTSLDELPELLNILKGDMSIVGPRPLLVEYLPLYTERQRRRHEVRPGLTGYAQAYGRNSLTWEDRFEKDAYYVEHLSLWLDIKVLFKTVAVVLKREGISSETSATMEEFTGSEAVEEEVHV